MVHGGRLVAHALHAEQVPFIFTLCGGHVMPIYDGCIDEGIRVIDVRHEQTAAHAADGWARVTGRPGVAVVTAGPGLTDAVTGVASAHRANVPMIIIGGQGPRPFADMGSLQDMNHVELMRPITKWSVAVPEGRRIPEYLSMAFRTATTGLPGPVFLEMPIDQLFDNYEMEKIWFPTDYRSEAGTAGDPRYIEKALAAIKGAAKPVALVGTQLRWSVRREAYPEFARTFGMPIYVNGLGRGSLRPEDPHFFSRTRKQALKQADVVLIFGTPLDFRIGYGRDSHINPEATLIQVDLDPRELGRNRPCNIGIVGDTGLVMEQLTQAARAEGYSAAMVKPWLDDMRTRERAELEKVQPQLNADDFPVNPLRACKEIADSVGENAIFVGDGGDFVATAASVVRVYQSGHWLDPGPLGTLGVGPGVRDGRQARKAGLAGDHHLRRRFVRPARHGVRGLCPPEDQHHRRDRQRRRVDADSPRPGADVRRGALGGDRPLVHALRESGRGARRPCRVRRARRGDPARRCSARWPPANRR
jgi:acetolactate synthase-1/2/3 large subunit